MATKKERKGRRHNGAGGLYQRADGKWVADLQVGYLPNGRPKRRKRICSTKKAAMEALDLLKTEAAKGLDSAAEKWTVADWLTRWLDTEVAGKRKVKTEATYRSSARLHLIPHLGGIRLRELTPTHVREYVDTRLAEGAKSQTVKNEYSNLRAALEIAARYGYVEKNVAALVPAPTAKNAKSTPFTPHEIKKVLAAARGHAWEALFNLVAGVGLRRGEVLGLAWDCVDLEAGTARIERALYRVNGEFVYDEPKSEAGKRTITLPAFAVEQLRSHRTRHLEHRLAAPEWRNEHDLVFTWGPCGEPIEPRRLQDAWTALLKEAGVRHVRLHDLRHGAATYLLKQGVPMKVVQEILGHSQMSITADLYSHVLPELQREAADRLNELFSTGTDD